MDRVIAALANPTIRIGYLVFCFALVIVPMIALSLWYRRRIHETPGGRALMKEQNRAGAVPRLMETPEMARKIAAGRYGEQARRMQGQVYVMCGLYIVLVAFAFGLLIWADRVNRVTH